MPTDLFVTYQFHSDASHGWLRVPVKEYQKVCELFDWKATPYSYRNTGFVFLEEDQDCPEFIAKVEAMGYVVRLEELRNTDWSPIRNYAPLS